MPLVALAIPLLTPLLLAPHYLFYYDITPKVALLLLGAGAALLLTALDWDSVSAFCGTRPGCCYFAAAVSSLAVTALATALAVNPGLAWNGSNWRRMGALTDFAIVPAAALIAAYASRSRDRLLLLLRAICAAGILSSLYGIAQYFGIDPFLPAAQYHVGEGVYQIVRPPGTMGHSDYFAAFLVWPVFAGLTLFRDEIPIQSRLFGAASALSGFVAILLSGSRGAVLALAAGLCVMTALLRPRLRTVAAALAGAVLILAIFYISPAGGLLRARVHWIGEEPAGGARLLLWRDSLKMASHRSLTGFGPDNFVAEFPQFQSLDLARAYPDFYNESPHNLLLDSLTSEGALGLLALAAIIATAIAGAIRARPKNPALVAALLPALAAAFLAHQFVVFTAANAFFFYLGAGLLAGASSPDVPARAESSSRILRYAVLAAACAVAALFSLAAFRLVSVDAALALVQQRLDANDPRAAAEAYRLALSRPTAGVSADLYLSRRFAAVAVASPDFSSKLYYSQIAAGAATLATRLPEGRYNAWYNMALLSAGRRDPGGVETCLRNTIVAAPLWYKPHWTLARLLDSQGRSQEAAQEARQALELNAGKDPEVASTIGQILRSRLPPP
jgi:O-antigen ligase